MMKMMVGYEGGEVGEERREVGRDDYCRAG